MKTWFAALTVVAVAGFAESGAARPGTPAPAVPASAGLDVVGPSAQQHLTAADIAALPHQSVSVIWHGASATYQGVMLSDLLARVGAPQGEALRGRDLADVVILTASDGYRVVLGLGEVERSIRVERIILADQQAGQPLSVNDGTFRLVIEGDLKPARSERRVQRIEWRRLDQTALAADSG